MAKQAEKEMSAQALVLAHQGIVFRVVQRFGVHRRGPSFEDAVSAGMIALVEAGARFNASKGAVFSTYAWYRIAGALKDWLTAENRAAQTPELEPEEPTAPAEFDPSNTVDAQLAVELSLASPELERAATRALGLLLTCEFDAGGGSPKDRRRRAALALNDVRKIATEERAQP